MNYINFKSAWGIETVEDLRGLPTKEKKRLLQEYRMVGGGHYYYSQRATKDYHAD